MGRSSHFAGLAGGVSGIAGGSVMVLVLAAHTAAAGEGIGAPFRSIGSFLPAQFSSAIGATLFGALVHYSLSWGWGVALGRAVDGNDSLLFGVGVGAFCGAVIWGLITFAVVPQTDANVHAWVASFPASIWLGAHIAYGAVAGLMLPSLDRRIRPDRVEN